MKVLNRMSTDLAIKHCEYYKSKGFDFLFTDFYWQVDDVERLLKYVYNRREDPIKAQLKISDFENQPTNYNRYLMGKIKPFVHDFVYNGSVCNIWNLPEQPVRDFVRKFEDNTKVADQRKRVARKGGDVDLIVEYFANNCKTPEEEMLMLPYAIVSQDMKWQNKLLTVATKRKVKERLGVVCADFQRLSKEGFPAYGAMPFHFVPNILGDDYEEFKKGILR